LNAFAIAASSAVFWLIGILHNSVQISNPVAGYARASCSASRQVATHGPGAVLPKIAATADRRFAHVCRLRTIEAAIPHLGDVSRRQQLWEIKPLPALPMGTRRKRG
jgi:hypothetical protein